MSTPDEEFMIRLRATFKVEAEEHLQAISSTLLELEKSASLPLRTTAVEGVFREAHSLKGAARAVDFSDVESICQAIEGVFASWKQEVTSPSPESLDALHRALDMIHALLESPDHSSSRDEPRPGDELIRRLHQFELRTAPADPLVQPASPLLPPSSALPPPAPLPSSSPLPRSAPLSPPPPHLSPVLTIPPAIQPPANPPVDLEKAVVSQTVRIPIDKLDSHLLQAEDMVVVKSMVAERATELREVNGRFDRLAARMGQGVG